MAHKRTETAPPGPERPEATPAVSSELTREQFLQANGPNALPTQAAPSDIIDEATLLERVPVSRRTAATWRAQGWLPHIKLPGRRILYSWAAVHSALLRRQRGAL
jgi:hypothetical protein